MKVLKCTKCGATFNAKSEAAGQTSECRKCGSRLKPFIPVPGWSLFLRVIGVVSLMIGAVAFVAGAN